MFFVSSQPLKPLFELARRFGIDTVVRPFGEEWHVTEVRRLFMQLIAKSGDTPLGLEIGKRVQPEDIGVIGELLSHAATLEGALGELARYYRLVSQSARVKLERNEKGARLSIFHGLCDVHFERIFQETHLSAFLGLFRRFAKDDLASARVFFAHGAPVGRDAYDAFFGHRVRFGHPSSYLFLAASDLMRPIALPPLGRGQASSFLKTGSWQNRIYRVLMDTHPGAPPALAAIARHVGLSPRHLQLTLQEEGTTYRAIRNAFLCEVAQAYLLDPGMSLTNIALMTGFSEESAFSRAFERWTGTRPGAFRRQRR